MAASGLGSAAVPQGGTQVGNQIVPSGYATNDQGQVVESVAVPGMGGKGGVAGAPAGGATTGSPYQPIPPQGGFNVNEAAASGLNKAMLGTEAAMSGPNVGAFMNPYTSMVTGTALNDLERQRQMTANTTGAQASQAGAFGGSRHGVADALTNEGFARQGSQMFSNLQQQGYNTALGAAQNQQNMQMSGAAQLGQLGNQAFNTGRSIQQDQATQGLLQQGIQQALIDASKGQFSNYANAPTNSLSGPIAALGSTPNQSSTTTSQKPGLLNYLSMFMGM